MFKNSVMFACGNTAFLLWFAWNKCINEHDEFRNYKRNIRQECYDCPFESEKNENTTEYNSKSFIRNDINKDTINMYSTSSNTARPLW